MLKTHPMWNNYPDIQEFLLECLKRIKEKTTIENKEIKNTVIQLIESQGKLLRPAYFFLFAQLGNASLDAKDNIIAAAASTEVLHLATLIHDDIIDEAKIRRGSETVQSKHGKDVAVYTGDLLLSVYFDLLADATDSIEIIKLNTLSMKRVLLGEINQMTNVFNTEITYEDYLKSIKGKTAQLFELSCYEGAYFGECDSEVIEKSRSISQNIGIAFQMLDDILDYTQSSEILSKPVLNDVKQGIYTLPLILGLERSEEFLPLLNKGNDLSDRDLDTLVTLLQEHNCIEHAHERAKQFIDEALRTIETLPSHPKKEILYVLTNQLLTRESKNEEIMMTFKQYVLLSQMEYASTSFFPGFMGILYAWYNYDTFHPGYSLLGLLTVGLFQLAISLRDNYLDYYVAEKKHTEDVQEMVLGGETISLKNIRKAYYITSGSALVVGLFLVLQTSFFLLLILLGGVLIGVFYTFGSLPISSTPFGDFSIGLVYGFGIFAALLYVNAFDVLHFDWLTLGQVIIASIPTSITVMSVSLANNICDLEEDIEDGRFTLPYHIGVDKALIIFKGFYYAGYIAIILSVIFGTFPRFVTLSLLTFPYVSKNIRIFLNKQDKETTFFTTITNSLVIPIPLIVTFFIGALFDI